MLEIDLHNKTLEEAKRALDNFINSLPEGKVTIKVIHGYNRGRILQDMIRKEYKHRRIERKILVLNQGITELELK